MAALTAKKKPTTKGRKLNEKQLRFAREYQIDLNATQAAIRAGYSKDTAGVIGHELLKKPKIQSAMKKERDLRMERVQITPDRIATELARIAFADLRDVVRVVKGKVVINDTNNLTDAQAVAISGIQEMKAGVKITTHNKVAAIDQLCKMFGLHKSTLDITGLLNLDVNRTFDIVIVDPGNPKALEHDVSRTEPSDDSEMG